MVFSVIIIITIIIIIIIIIIIFAKMNANLVSIGSKE